MRCRVVWYLRTCFPRLQGRRAVIEQISLAVTLWTCIRKVSIQISAGKSSNMIQLSHGLSESLHRNIRIVSPLGHGRFLPDPFQFIIHMSSYHRMVWFLATESVVKQIRIKTDGNGNTCAIWRRHVSPQYCHIFWGT
jgi:hypothetical protein